MIEQIKSTINNNIAVEKLRDVPEDADWIILEAPGTFRLEITKTAQALLALFVKILKEAMPEKKLFAGRYELIEPLSEKYDEIALMCGYNQTLADLKQNLKKVGIEI